MGSTIPCPPPPVHTTEMAIAVEEKIMSLLKTCSETTRMHIINGVLLTYCKGCGAEHPDVGCCGCEDDD